MIEKIELFKDKNECCACGACVSVCPKNAISMQIDENGFSYPHIDHAKCIKCGACKRACGFQNQPPFCLPIKVYAASAKSKDVLNKSASGGAFAIVASNILSCGGYVYGAALEMQEGKLVPKHICISDVSQLSRLQGSKYVRSNVSAVYKEIKDKVQNGDLILFSGTPCQVASLKRFLGKDYENIFFIDIICHGVPEQQLFYDFIDYREKKLKGIITDFNFRDKSRGQGYTTRTEYERGGRKYYKTNKGEKFAYIRFFSKSFTLRENCYNCPYSQKERISDLTIGDFWGFSDEYPNRIGELFNEKDGISCILCNSSKGEELIENCRDALNIFQTDYSSVLRYNKQLNKPSFKPLQRAELYENYKSDGYEALEKYYWKHFFFEKVKYIILELIPQDVINAIKKKAH